MAHYGVTRVWCFIDGIKLDKALIYFASTMDYDCFDTNLSIYVFAYEVTNIKYDLIHQYRVMRSRRASNMEGVAL